MSGRLVAAITTMSCRDIMPSISVSSWLITRSETPLSDIPMPRRGVKESISSRKITVGAAILAFRNTSRIAFSDSPTHFEKTSGPLIEMKLASLSVATARASRVLPQPGGPYSKYAFWCSYSKSSEHFGGFDWPLN